MAVLLGIEAEKSEWKDSGYVGTRDRWFAGISESGSYMS